MADKKLFEQPLKTELGGGDRIVIGIPGQDGCDNMLATVFIDTIKNEGISSATFSNSDLSSDILEINHAQNTLAVELTIYDNSGVLQDLSGMLRIVDVDNIEVDFGGAIVGIWTYILKYWNL